ncbi:MAG: hypothetical protein K2X82_14975 [Gemmataceae bacterium]|nr:hypothetical protein [Gemmataceae bacterium]
MTPITIDPELIAKLTANGGRVPLAAPDGTPVGYFLTPDRLARLETAAAGGRPEVTEEDCRRALANPKRHSTAEVLKLLGGK